MTGPTHRKYSVCFALITVMLFYKYNITSIDYYISLLILLSASKSGALFPDVDHHWQNVSEKTVPNRIINFLIHLTGGKHRSWQTHSIDICAYFTIGSYIIPKILYNLGKISLVNMEIGSLLLLGFASGWISHLFSDMLTSAGVRVIFFINKKIAFVPKKLFKLRFNTGNEWEKFNYKAMSIINVILGVAALIYPFITHTT